MHDPMVVAFEIRRLWPRKLFHPTRLKKPRPRNLWPRYGFTRIGDREWYWPTMVTVWHVEPGGRDALTVCQRRYRDKQGKWRYSKGWHWHVHHWRIQVVPIRKLRRFLFERCTECGRRYPWGYAPVSHQWDEPLGKWFRITRRAYHHECSSLVTYRRETEYCGELIKYLAIEIQGRSLEDELSMVDRLTGTGTSLEFALSYRLQRILGFERDEDYNLVKKEAES